MSCQNTAALAITIRYLTVIGFLATSLVTGCTPTNRTSRLRAKAEGDFRRAASLHRAYQEEFTRQAIKLYGQAAAGFENGGDHIEAARALRECGELRLSLGEMAPAYEDFRRAQQFCEAASANTCQSEALNRIARVQLQMGQLRAAEKTIADVLRIQSATSDPRSAALALDNLGQLSLNKGDPRTALDRFADALGRWREIGDERGQAATHLNMGLARIEVGELQRSLVDYQEALAHWQALGDRHGEAVTLVYLGHNYSMRADKQAALRAYERAEELLRPLGDKATEASLLSGMAYLYDEYGDPRRALAYRQKALALYRTAGVRHEAAVALKQLAELTHRLGDQRQSLEYFREARAEFQAMNDRRLEAHALSSLGVVYEESGELSRAEEYYREALTISRVVGDKRWEATALNNLGELHRRGGRYREAQRMLEDALRLGREAEDRAGEALSLYLLSRIEQVRGRLTRARRHVEESIDIVERQRAQVTGTGLRTSILAATRHRYEHYVDVLMRLHARRPGSGYDGLALAVSERGRARSLLDLLAETHTDITEGVAAELLERRRGLQLRLNRKAEQLVAGNQTTEEGDGARRTRAEIEDLVTQLEEAESRIRSASPRYAALARLDSIDLTGIQRLLDSESVLLAYALGEEKSYLWVVTRRGLKTVELPARGQIESLALDAHRNLSGHAVAGEGTPDERQRRREALREAAQENLKALGRILLGPVRKELGRRRLLVVAEGALQFVPFGALPSPERDAGDEPLITRHEIVNLPSATALSRLRSDAHRQRTAADGVLVLADPVFTRDDPRIQTGSKNATVSVEGGAGRTFARLLASRDEAAAIGAAVGQERISIKTGLEVNRRFVMGGELSGYRIVHFATHGWIDAQVPELSGLALSMFDRVGKREDGYLRLHEIFNLRLATDLVVLSACDTAIGKEVRGEGLIALTRGFMYSGARRVVSSLWKVDDNATMELMSHFYRGLLQERMTPAASLRRAQLEMLGRTRWRAPYYWAAFIIQGDDR